MLRGVERREGRIVVKLTPTYTGCPATLAIQLAVEAALAEAGMPTPGRDRAVAAVVDRRHHRGGPPQAEGVRHRPAGRAARVPARCSRDETVACPKCGSTATSQDLRVRLDRLQGAVALRGLRRALRLLQVPLSAGPMRDFQPLTIAEVRRETPEAISVTFAVPEPLREAFRFKPGQHLPVRAMHRRRGAAAHLFDLLARPARPTCASPSSASPTGASPTGPTTRWRPAARSTSMPPAGRFVLPESDGSAAPRRRVRRRRRHHADHGHGQARAGARSRAPASRSSTATARPRASCSARSWRT